MKRLVISILVLAGAGCATSSVVQVGPGLYSLSVKRCDLCSSAPGAATEQAGQYCVAQGKYLVVRGMNVIPEFGHDVATINFSCVTADDPEYTRPK
jgi:hypothetical protein